MGDSLFKLKFLFIYLSYICKEWKIDVWDKDLDSEYHCEDTDCYCGNSTIREAIKEQTDGLQGD